MFGGLYFAAGEGDGECRLSALDGLMCVTPLPEKFHQTPGAQEILRLVLKDAMRRDDLRRAARSVHQRYLRYDRYDFLKNLGSYRKSSKDYDLIEELKEGGKGRITTFCSPEKGYFRRHFEGLKKQDG